MAIGGWIGLLDDIATLAKLSTASLDDVSAAAERAEKKTGGGGVAPYFCQYGACHDAIALYTW